MKISHFGSAIAFLTLSFGASAANAQPDNTPRGVVTRPKPPRVRATEPGQQITQDLLDFAELLNTGPIFPDGQQWIYGARQGFFGANEWAREADLIKMRPAGITLKIEDITVDKIEGETATATVTYAYAAPAGLQAPERELLARERTEVLQLKVGALPFVREKKWQIVPPGAEPPTNRGNATDELDNVFSRVSFALAQNSTFKAPNSKAKRTMSNMKQLSLGVMQFVQDYNERYAFAPQYLQEAIFAYVKSREVFVSPSNNEPYSFNGNLSDKSFAQVPEPSKTVMFYEGVDEKPLFRYDGQAAIGFADGHVVLVSPEEAKNLIWKP